jgi:formimidoylglutamate deiminase
VLAMKVGESTGRRLFDAALAGGARALGMSAVGLAVGAAADIVSLDAEHPSLVERRDDAILDSWIFSGGARLVDCVWQQGSKVVAAGSHSSRAPIAARYAQVLKKLLS